MLNSQLHQHQSSHLPHHALSSTDHGGNGVGSGSAGNGSTNGYFIFDDLTTALQLQDRSNNDQLSALSSSSLSSVNNNNGNGIATTLHQQQHQHASHLTLTQQHSHSLPMLTSSSTSPPTASHLHHQSPQLQPSHHPFQQPSQKCNFGGDTTYHFKTLVPAVAAGAIIGKGGETIAAIQKDTGARVKMSKSHDFYPGTSERVCLISGSLESILTVLDFIMEKIREKPDQTPKLTDIETKQAQERDKQVKILVPNSTAGMIIGKAGAYIKQIKEESGSYVQISQKPKDITLQERCITIIGDKDNNKVACKLILAKIMEDPSSGTCLNVSYAEMNGPVANFNPTGSPYAAPNQNTISSSTASLNSAVSAPGLLVNGTGINLSFNLGPSSNPNPAVTTQVLDHIKVAMRGSGYSEPATSEVLAALGILAKYGVLGLGVGLSHTNGTHSHSTPTAISYLGVSGLEQPTSVASSGVFGAIGQVNLDSYMSATSPTPRTSLERYDTTAFDPFRHAGQQAATPISINTNNFGLATSTAIGAAASAAQTLGALSKSPTPGDVSLRDTKNVEIPEVIVGAILGPSGRSLVEIQNMSGATIQISKKGIFAPGTKNRIVTISGPPNAIALAHIFIDQKINDEEAKRRAQNTLTGITGMIGQ